VRMRPSFDPITTPHMSNRGIHQCRSQQPIRAGRWAKPRASAAAHSPRPRACSVRSPGHNPRGASGWPWEPSRKPDALKETAARRASERPGCADRAHTAEGWRCQIQAASNNRLPLAKRAALLARWPGAPVSSITLTPPLPCCDHSRNRRWRARGQRRFAEDVLLTASWATTKAVSRIEASGRFARSLATIGDQTS